VLDDGVWPRPPRRFGRELAQVWLLVPQHPFGLVAGHLEQQLLLALGKGVEELALTRAGARPDVVQGGDRDAMLT
jgi:hypothetical protein